MQSNNVKCYKKPLNYGVPSFGQTHVKKKPGPYKVFFLQPLDFWNIIGWPLNDFPDKPWKNWFWVGIWYWSVCKCTCLYAVPIVFRISWLYLPYTLISTLNQIVPSHLDVAILQSLPRSKLNLFHGNGVNGETDPLHSPLHPASSNLVARSPALVAARSRSHCSPLPWSSWRRERCGTTKRAKVQTQFVAGAETGKEDCFTMESADGW